MRIEGYLEHPILKITVFKMDNRFSVKFETRNYEQTYKLRMGNGMDTFENVKKWVDDEMKENVLSHFNLMHQLSLQQYLKMEPSDEDEFEDII